MLGVRKSVRERLNLSNCMYTIFNDGISDKLRKAICDYVAAKHLIDEISGRLGSQIVAGELANDSCGPVCGMDFFIKTFPFLSTNSDIKKGKEFTALVPTKQVVGASYRWTPETVIDKEELLKHLQTLHLRTEKHIEIAEYFWIKPLGLFLTHEGKNRVAFFRAMRCDHIPALVITCDYPAADRLALFQVTLHGRNKWLIVLDNRFVELLEHKRWSLPVLKHYGVAVSDVWPSDYPPVASVLEDCCTAIKSQSDTQSVDLQAKKYKPSKHQGWRQLFRVA
jgi:hypothetical protein